MASPYKMFKTDPQAEARGIRMAFSEGPNEFYLLVARSGGSNEIFNKTLNERQAAFREAAAPPSQEEQDKVVKETFVETCILGWGSKLHGDNKLEGESGEVMDFSYKAALKLLNDLPELFMQVLRRAGDYRNYRAHRIEADAGN